MSTALFSTTNPATGTEVSRYPNSSREDVEGAVARAKVAGMHWQSLGARGRRKTLLKWARYLTDHIDEGARWVYEETGKPVSDATLEFTLAIGHLAWAAKNAEFILAPQRRRPGLLMVNMRATVERKPYGVIGVIGPWNYPVFTPMGSIAYALAAGNAVVLKPSEYTPGVAVWLAESFAKVSPIADLFTVVPGLPETGKFLTESAVEKVAFTGSTRTAKKVAASCAERMTPVVLECGGKDAVIVDRDADITLAAENTLWSAMSNAGQTCIGAERVYVHEAVAEEFIDRITQLARKVESGKNYGPATMPSQLKVISSHLQDAKKMGGTFRLGGLDSVGERFVSPVVITDLDESSLAVQEETFGPTLVINRVRDMEDAIERTNATRYGLGAAVFSKRHGEEIASKIASGMVSINSVISFAAVASVPFGGIKESGFGRIHGPEGLLEFTYPKSTVQARFQLPLAFTTFRRSNFADKLVVKLIKMLHGRSLG
jgi:acyl-CoA reductase-like NAD-dependent aldehyde dehydrogenase